MKRILDRWLAPTLLGAMIVAVLTVLSSIAERPDRFLAGALFPFVVLYLKEIFRNDR